MPRTRMISSAQSATTPPSTARAPYLLRDGAFLALVILTSLVLYLPGLGSYADDWHFLHLFGSASDQSVGGLARAMFAYDQNAAQRPTMVIYLAVLYALSGAQPLGYYLANAVMLVATVTLFYVVLREVGQSRIVCLGVPLIYGLLPLYSSARFWMAATQIVLSMSLYFLSLYGDLRAVRQAGPRLLLWRLLSLVCLLGSTMAYEVAMPLFLINPVLAWYQARRLHGPINARQLMRKHAVLLVVSQLVTLVAVGVFKAAVTKRLVMYGTYADYLGKLVVGGVAVNFGDDVVLLPYTAWWSLGNYHVAGIPFVSAGLGVVIAMYLFWVARQGESAWSSAREYATLVGAGVAVYVLGYAIFLTQANVRFSNTGIYNRTAIAAAAGMALLVVGGLGWLTCQFRSRWVGKSAFCLGLTTMCVAGFVVTNTIASFWTRGYAEEQAILRDMRSNLQSPPLQSVLLISGVCDFDGPAPLFNSPDFMTGAVRALYHDNSLSADFVSPHLSVAEDGISTQFGTDSQGRPLSGALYPYSREVLLFNAGDGGVARITGADVARGALRNDASMRGMLARGALTSTASPSSLVFSTVRRFKPQ